jgi:hypothetical protein
MLDASYRKLRKIPALVKQTYLVSESPSQVVLIPDLAGTISRGA